MQLRDGPARPFRLEAGPCFNRLQSRVVRELMGWRVAGPTPAETRDLARFVEGFPTAGAFRAVLEREGRSRTDDLSPLAPRPSTVLQAALAQTGLFKIWFWLASAATLAAGLLFLAVTDTDAVSCLAVLTPLLAAFGVAYAFRAANTGAWEMEMSCPVSPVHMTLGRLVVVVTYDILLGVGASLAVWWGSPPAVLTSLTVTWLVPLFITASLTFHLCLNPRLGSSVAAGLTAGFWAAQVLIRKTGVALSLFARPGDEGWAAVQLLSLAGAALLVWASVRSLSLRPALSPVRVRAAGGGEP